MKNVREGYKMTELGEIPKEWEIKGLVEVADKSDRYSFTGGPFGSNLKSCHYTDYGVRVIQLQNIGDGNFINSNFTYTSELKANELMSCNIYCGDIIIAKMAEPVARACKIPDYEKRYLMCSDGIRLSVDKDNNEVDFIMYSINSKYFRKNAIANSTGSTRLRIGLSELKNLPIIIPTLKEQQKISLILNSVDKQIEINDKLIEKTKKLKKGLAQSFFTKGIGHERFKETEVGSIPEEWDVVRIKDVADIISGGTPSTVESKYWNNGTIFWATPTDITSNGKYISKTANYITESGLKNSSANLLPVGSVLMTSRATIGERCINKVPMCTNQGFKSFICRDNLHNEFMYYLIDMIKYELISLAGGSTFLEVSKSSVEAYKIILPCLEEQKQIASILSSIDEKIDQYESKKEKLQELKKGLMQKLLTGKVRVQ